VISRCKFCKNGFFNTFFPLSHTCHFETRPRPLSKIKENAFGTHFLRLYRKNEYSDPHFLFHNFNKDIASFLWEKNFLAILLNCTDWAITGRIAQVQFNSTFERKVKTMGIKRHFSGTYVDKQYIEVKFCAIPHASSKNLSFLSSFGLCAVLSKCPE